MVAERSSGILSLPPLRAMSTSAGPSAAAQTFDPAALSAWTQEVEERLAVQTSSLTGLHVQLGATIAQAKAAMEAIVAGVSFELLAFKRQVHTDHGKLDELVGHLQRKFLDVEHVVQGLAGETAAKFAAVDDRAGRAEQRVTELLAKFASLPDRLLPDGDVAQGSGGYGPASRTGRPAPGESPAGSAMRCVLDVQHLLVHFHRRHPGLDGCQHLDVIGRSISIPFCLAAFPPSMLVRRTENRQKCDRIPHVVSVDFLSLPGVAPLLFRTVCC